MMTAFEPPNPSICTIQRVSSYTIFGIANTYDECTVCQILADRLLYETKRMAGELSTTLLAPDRQKLKDDLFIFL